MTELQNGQITDLLNNGMRYNPETISIGYAILQEKRRIMDFADRTRLMSAIDELDERILNYLAVELRTPAYDDSFPLETKRELIKGTLPFYAQLGTVAAVEWIIRTLVGNGTVEEWFEYDGNPYCFRVSIDVPDRPVTLEEAEQVMRGIFQCKNLRSHLDVVQYIIHIPPSILHIGGAVEFVVKIGIPEAPYEPDFIEKLCIGGTNGIHASTGIPEAPYKPDFTETLRMGGTNGIHSTTGIPEAAYRPDFTETLHVGGNTGILAEYSIPQETGPPSFSIQRTGSVCTIIMNPSEGS